MKKKKIINSLSKKFFIKGVATTLVVLLPFSFIKPRETKAIVGVDDALLVAGASILAVGGIGAYMGLKNTDLAEKLASNVSDNISQFGSSARNIYDNLAFGYNVSNMLPNLLNAYGEHLEGIENIESDSIPTDTGNYFKYSCSVGNVFEGVANKDGSVYLCISSNDGKEHNATSETGRYITYKAGDNVKVVLRYAYDTSYKPSYPHCYMMVGFVNGVQETYGYSYLQDKCNIFYINIPHDFSAIDYQSKILTPLPPITDVDTKNYPSTISLSKDKVQEYVGEYVEQNPEDNDNKPDYSQLIPFMFNLLEKDLGNGEITPQNLSNNGICSYVYPDGTSLGYYPYFISDLPSTSTPSGSDLTVNVNVQNGAEVSEEEKNGILNMLDNGVRKTTTLLNNLKNSMSNLGNTLKGLFDLLPEPVGYLFYSALCLSLIFFILSLRR